MVSGKWIADLVMLLVTAIWALNNISAKISLAPWSTPGAYNAIRFSLGGVVLALWTLKAEGSLRLPRDLFPKVALLGLIGNGLNQMLFISGLALGTASNAAVWQAIVPVIVALIAGAFGFEQVRMRIWLGALISAGGIVAVFLAQGHGFHIGAGDMFFAGAITTWAGYTVFSRPLVRNVSPLRVTAVAMLVGSVGLLIYNAPQLLAQDYRAIPLYSWMGMVYGGLISNALGYSLYVWAIRRIGAARVALYNNLSPIFTIAAAIIWIGERVTLAQWLGVALVIGGVLVARWDDIWQVHKEGRIVEGGDRAGDQEASPGA